MSIVMYDAIYVSALPPGQPAYAGYVGGFWPTFPALKTAFPNAHLLSIAVNASQDADCLDVEKYDATIPEVYGWFIRQLARGTWRPVIYISAGQLDALVATMTANGFTRSQYRLWSAHYGQGEHVCGPATCGLTRTACDATQWTSTALSRSLDQSILNDDFFGTTPAPSPAPTPTEDDMPNGVIRTPVGVAENRSWLEASASQIVLFSLWQGVQTTPPVIELTVAHLNSKPFTTTVTLPANGTYVYQLVNKADCNGCSFKRIDGGVATVAFHTNA